jgi:hypothetical protein
MTNIYWLNPVTQHSTSSSAESYTESFTNVTAPGLDWSVAVNATSAGAVLWGPLTGGPLHFIYHGRTWAATR